jgi:hypothetical protein
MATRTGKQMEVHEVQKMMESHSQFEGKRLDRIEEKIDRLAETVVSIARAEEKLVNLEHDRNIILDRLVKIEEKIDGLDTRIIDSETTVKVINRIFWIVLTAVVGAIVALYTK